MDNGVVPAQTFFKFLATSSGGIEMNAAGSSGAAITFSVSPDTSRGPISLNRVNVTLVAASFFSHTGFGGGVALSNGLKVEVVSTGGDQLADFLDGETIQENHEWTWLAGADVVNAAATSAQTDYAKAVRWTLDRAGAPLHLGIGSSLRVSVQDDLSSSGVLVEFNAMAQGFYQK